MLHRKLADERDTTAAIHQRLVAREREARVDEARRLILTAEPAPYRLEHNRLILDLSAMPAAARRTVESVAHDDLGHALRERHRMDEQRAAEERKAADAAATRAEAERVAELARRALVEEACRILRNAEPRPYRRSGNRIEPDWATLSERERATVIAVGIGVDDLRRALLERARRDERGDRTSDMLDTIERERRPVSMVDGHRQVDAQTLAAFGLRDADIHNEPVQRQLEDIASQQLGEIAMVEAYAAAHPDELLRDDTGWSLGKAAPAVMRELVEAWQHDGELQTFLGNIAKETGTSVLKPATPGLTMAGVSTGDAHHSGMRDAPAPMASPPLSQAGHHPEVPPASAASLSQQGDGKAGGPPRRAPIIDDPGTAR